MKEKSVVKIVVAIIGVASVLITAIAMIVSSLFSKGTNITINNIFPNDQSTHEPSNSTNYATSTSIKNDNLSSNVDNESVISNSSISVSTSSHIPESTKNEISGWVLSSNVPYGAEIVAQKWEYTKGETKESENANESGWTLTGSYWKSTGAERT